MKEKFSDLLEKHREQLIGYPETKKGDKQGYFRIKKNGNLYHCIVSSGMDWDHVSVTLDKNRMPTWDEMCFIKSLFWDDDEAVIQIHPKKTDYVNFHKQCLHLWKYQGDFPLPDSLMVGPK